MTETTLPIPYDKQCKVVFEAIWQLMVPPTRTQRLGL